LPDGPEKAAAALDLFGKSGVDMITMLNGGSAALEEFNFGLSGEFAQNAAFYNDEVTKLGREFEKFKLQLVDALLPALTQITQSFATLFDEGTNLEPLFMVIGGSIRGVAAVVFSTIKLVDALIKIITDGGAIVVKVLSGDFAGAIELARNGVGNFVEDAKKDFEELGKIIQGTATAPEGYTRLTRGSVLNQLDEEDEDGETSKDKTKPDKPKPQVSAEVLRLTKEINAARLAGNKLAEVDLGYDLAIQQLREKGLTGNNLELAQNQLLTDYTLDRLDAVQALADAQDNLNDKTEDYSITLDQIRDTLANQMTSAIEGLIDGTRSLGESLSGLLKTFASMFLQSGVKSLVASIFPSAYGNVVAKNKIVPFAYGGVVNKPTLFPMANGAGLMGEAGPEAIMPLRRTASGRLGVESSGGVGNVVVNVDATGSSVQGDQPDAEQLGRVIGQAVQAELIKQKRPGGLLTR
jgi:hypothetical protein